MARFWGAIIGRVVISLWLVYLIGVLAAQGGSYGWREEVAAVGSGLIVAFLLLQTVAALGGYVSIKSRVKKAKRDGSPTNHRP